VLEKAHNHAPSAAVTAHPAHRIAALSSETRATIGSMLTAGLLPAQILTTLRVSNAEIPLILKDIANIT
jgi:hypothetical protein